MRLPRRTNLPLLAGAAALAALVGAGLWQSDVVLYNATPSVPVGFYLRTSGPIERGAIVTARARDAAPRYAAERNFTDEGDRFLKRVAGAAGDEVCAAGAAVTLNGARVAERQAQDAARRPLPTWEGCRILDASEVFLLGDTMDSFDGRYWGPTPVERIEGVWRRFGS